MSTPYMFESPNPLFVNDFPSANNEYPDQGIPLDSIAFEFNPTWFEPEGAQVSYDFAIPMEEGLFDASPLDFSGTGMGTVESVGTSAASSQNSPGLFDRFQFDPNAVLPLPTDTLHYPHGMYVKQEPILPTLNPQGTYEKQEPILPPLNPHGIHVKQEPSLPPPNPQPSHDFQTVLPAKPHRKSLTTARDRFFPKEKASHNVIEKRYRNNINDKINFLRDCVPSLRYCVLRQEAHDSNTGGSPYSGDSLPSGSATDETDYHPDIDLEGLKPANKLNKATILTKTIEYIQHLEKKNKRLQMQNQELQSRGGLVDPMVVAAPSITTYSSQEPLQSAMAAATPRRGLSLQGKVVFGGLACLAGTSLRLDFEGGNQSSLLALPGIGLLPESSLRFLKVAMVVYALGWLLQLVLFSPTSEKTAAIAINPVATAPSDFTAVMASALRYRLEAISANTLLASLHTAHAAPLRVVFGVLYRLQRFVADRRSLWLFSRAQAMDRCRAGTAPGESLVASLSPEDANGTLTDAQLVEGFNRCVVESQVRALQCGVAQYNYRRAVGHTQTDKSESHSDLLVEELKQLQSKITECEAYTALHFPLDATLTALVVLCRLLLDDAAAVETLKGLPPSTTDKISLQALAVRSKVMAGTVTAAQVSSWISVNLPKDKTRATKVLLAKLDMKRFASLFSLVVVLNHQMRDQMCFSLSKGVPSVSGIEVMLSSLRVFCSDSGDWDCYEPFKLLAVELLVSLDYRINGFGDCAQTASEDESQTSLSEDAFAATESYGGYGVY